MSLLRLLAAGRSLVGMKDTTSRYRMRTANLLPKFVSPKNPFATTPKTAPAKTEPAAVPTSPAPAASKPEPVKMETTPLFDCKPKQVTAAAKAPATPVSEAAIPAAAMPAPAPATKPRQAKPVAKGPVKLSVKVESKPAAPASVASPKKPASVGSWVKKINPLSYLPSREPSQKKSVKPGRAPVQGELSLEKVKVVRNDLSDADVEIIAARPAESIRENSSRESAITEAVPAWNRLTSGLIAAGQTLMH